MEEIGTAEWFAIGVTGLALAGAAHATAGLAHIAREILRGPTDDPAAAGSDLQVISVSNGASRARWHHPPGHPFDRGNSHAGPGGQRPSCRTAKNITRERGFAPGPGGFSRTVRRCAGRGPCCCRGWP